MGRAADFLYADPETLIPDGEAPFAETFSALPTLTIRQLVGYVFVRPSLDGHTHVRAFGRRERLQHMHVRDAGGKWELYGQIPVLPPHRPDYPWALMHDDRAANKPVAGDTNHIKVDGSRVNLYGPIVVVVEVQPETIVLVEDVVGTVFVEHPGGTVVARAAGVLTRVVLEQAQAFHADIEANGSAIVESGPNLYVCKLVNRGRLTAELGGVQDKFDVSLTGEYESSVAVQGGDTRAVTVRIDGDGQVYHHGWVLTQPEVTVQDRGQVWLNEQMYTG